MLAAISELLAYRFSPTWENTTADGQDINQERQT